MKTYLYNFDSFNPTFNQLFFLFMLKNIDCRYSSPSEAVKTTTHTLYLEQKYEEYKIFYLNTLFLVLIFFNISK